MDLKDLGGQLIGMGAPVLGKIIGSLIPIPGGALIGEQAGKILADALGTTNNPEEIVNAIAKEDPAVVIAKIKAAEIEAAARWPALADMARAQLDAETKQWEAQLIDVQSARLRDKDVTTNGGVNARANILISLAFLYIMSSTAFIFMKLTDLSQPNAVAILTFLTTTMGIAMQWISQVFNFEFGSTRSSGQKTDQIQQLTHQATAAASSLVAAQAAAAVKK